MTEIESLIKPDGPKHTPEHVGGQRAPLVGFTSFLFLLFPSVFLTFVPSTKAHYYEDVLFFLLQQTIDTSEHKQNSKKLTFRPCRSLTVQLQKGTFFRRDKKIYLSF